MVTFWQTRLKQLTNHWTSGPLVVFLFLDKSRFIYMKNIIQQLTNFSLTLLSSFHLQDKLGGGFQRFQSFSGVENFNFEFFDSKKTLNFRPQPLPMPMPPGCDQQKHVPKHAPGPPARSTYTRSCGSRSTAACPGNTEKPKKHQKFRLVRLISDKMVVFYGTLSPPIKTREIITVQTLFKIYSNNSHLMVGKSKLTLTHTSRKQWIFKRMSSTEIIEKIWKVVF